jgi:hypothetical protein
MRTSFSANRLAHVCFLREETGRPSWLMNLCFTSDRSTQHSETEWQVALKVIKVELGFGARPAPYTVDIFLAARGRTELVPHAKTT